MGLVEVTPPANEPVSLPDAKEHLRILGTEDDAYVTLLVKGARQKVEIDTCRALTTTAYKATFDGFPDCRIIELERPPLLTVTSIQYYDSAGDIQTLDADQYLVQLGSEPGYIELKSEYQWPTTRWESQAVIVNYTAGYGLLATTVPENLRHAIKFLVSHLYSNREPVTALAQMSKVPLTYEFLTLPYRVYTNG